MSPTCIVLAGGLGTRLRSAVPDRPKCLAPVGARPFLALQLQLLQRRGIERIVLALGHGAAAVRDAVMAFDGALRVDSVVEPSPLGTGGALRHALRAWGLAEALVVNGDTWIDADLAGLQRPLGGGESMRLGLVRVADRARYGGVALDESGRITHFAPSGRPGPGLVNAGIARLTLAAFDAVADSVPCSLEVDVLPALAGRGALGGVVLEGDFIDIGVPEDYRLFCARHGGAA